MLHFLEPTMPPARVPCRLRDARPCAGLRLFRAWCLLSYPQLPHIKDLCPPLQHPFHSFCGTRVPNCWILPLPHRPSAHAHSPALPETLRPP
jgi:hypothetical protein